MSVYILRWNPKISSYKKANHKDLILHMKKGEHPLNFNWSIREWENLRKDDLFILQQVGTDNDGIAMFGKFKGPCYESDSWKKDGSKLHYADMWIMEAFDCDEDNILPAKRFEKLFPEIKWHGGHSGVMVQPEIADDLIKLIEKDLIKAGIWNKDSLKKFKDFNEPEMINEGLSGRPTADDLADGKILLQIKHNFIENQNKENFVQLVCCLHDSTVTVPMHIEISDDGKEPKYYPMTLGNEEGVTALAIFSNRDEIRGHYTEDEACVFFDLSMQECIDFFKEQDDCSVIALDGFGESLIIDKELAELIESITYKDEDTEE